MLRCYEPAHIVGVSKTAYVLATPRCLEWRRDPQPTSTNNDPSDSDSLDPCRRPAGRHRGDRRSPRRPVAGVLVLDGVLVPDGRITHRGPSRRAPWCARRGRRCRPRRRDGLRRRDSGCSQPRSSSPRCPAPGATDAADDGVEFFVDSGWRSPEYQEQLLQRGGLEVRLRRGSRPMGGHPQHVCSRVGGRGRHRALRCHGVAVRARRRVRAVPDLRQRTLALRTAPRSHRSRLPSHVRRPYARSKDAAVTQQPAPRSISSAYRKPHTRRQHPAALTGGMIHSEPARTAARRTRSPASSSSSAVPTMGITIYGCGQDEAALFRELAPRLGVVPTITEAAVSEGNVGLALGNRCISIGHKTHVTNSTLLALSEAGVTYISTRSVGYNHIDVDYAESRRHLRRNGRLLARQRG